MTNEHTKAQAGADELIAELRAGQADNDRYGETMIRAANMLEHLTTQPAAPSPVVERIIDACADYMTEQYGISALRHPVDRQRVIAALAQPAKAGDAEPVAWMYSEEGKLPLISTFRINPAVYGCAGRPETPLYAHPPAQPQSEKMRGIKTWEQRCEEHTDHEEFCVTPDMIQARMQEEIDDLRAALSITPKDEGEAA